MGSGEEKKPSMSKGKLSPRSESKELTRLAYTHLQKGDHKKATECFHTAAKLAKDEGDAITMISCYLNAGACLVSRNQVKQGSSFLLMALKLAKSQKPEENVAQTANGDNSEASIIEIIADIYYNLAVAAQKANDYKKASSYFKTSAEFYLKTGCTLQAAESFMSLAGCHRHSGEAEKEIENLQSAQQLFHQLEDHYSEADVCLEMAKTYLKRTKTEQAREMLSTAKLLCMRVDSSNLKGKLYSQFGLIYTSMGLFDMGIHNFERALPLVREGARSEEKSEELLQAEAALLQNIGAAYNEKALFLDAIVYHKEAAAIHGKLNNYNSECKSLCNLAYALTQLSQFQEAANTFSKATYKAHQAGNNYLHFQIYEGLGSINQKMGRHGDAIICFQKGLVILNQIKDDTGIARERVMEKLSEATEALEKSKGPLQEVKDTTSSSELRQGFDASNESGKVKPYQLRRNTLDSLLSSVEREREGALTDTMGSVFNTPDYKDSLFSKPENSPTLLDPLPHSPITPLPKTPPLGFNDQPRPSISQRRGVKALPPIPATKPAPVHKHAVTTSKKGKTKLLSQKAEDSDYSAELKAYMDSYMDSSEEGELHDSSSHSSHTNNNAQVTRNTAAPKEPSPPTGPEVLDEEDGAEDASQPRAVREGSLAIGQDARENFTVETVEEWTTAKGGKRKRHLKKEIVQTSSSATEGLPATSKHRDSNSTNQTSSKHRDSTLTSSTNQSRTQSKVCIIL